MSSAQERGQSVSRFSLSVIGEGRDRRFRLAGGENLIGSLPSLQVCLKESGVSRRHAALDVDPASLVLRDLGSKNGTFLNGRRIEAAPVRVGDVIEVGKVKVKVEEVDPEDVELGFSLSAVAPGPAEGLSFRDTTWMGAVASRAEMRWPRLFEDIVQCLCQQPADLRGALTHLVREAGLVGGALVEIPAAGDPSLLQGVGNLSGDWLLEGLSACVDHRDLASTEARTGSSFRLMGEPEISASLRLEGERPLGLLLAGQPPVPAAVEPLARSILLLIQRLSLESPPAPMEGRGPVRRLESVVSQLDFPAAYLPGESTAMEQLYAQMGPLLEGDLPVLVLGETGVGKELLARTLHRSSSYREGPFVAINCAAIPEDLLEAELFGIEKGVATGVKRRAGKFLLADGGTLFLDEIGDMATHLQAKLLRALQEGEVHPVGGAPVKVDVRVVSSTNTDLKAKAEVGHFRQDLYYRLAGYTLLIPPLRDRREDIPGLVQHFAERFSGEIGKPIRGVTVKVLRALTDYSWPGNVRELEHEVSRLVYACQEGQPIESTLLSRHLREGGEPEGGAPVSNLRSLSSSSLNLAEIEKEAIERALAASHNKLVDAASMLGISRDALRRRMDRYDLGSQ